MCSPSSSTSPLLHRVRQQLSELRPPRWTRQQQPKRVYKSQKERDFSISTSVSASASMVRYNEKQIKILSLNFAKNSIPQSCDFRRIAKETGLDHHQVKKWFQNRRAKERRKMQKQKFLKFE